MVVRLGAGSTFLMKLPDYSYHICYSILILINMVFSPVVIFRVSVTKREVYIFVIVPQGIIVLYKYPLDRGRIVFYVYN